MSSSNRFKQLLDKPNDDGKRCWLCNKSEDDIRADYQEAMKKPENIGKEIDMDSVLIMSFKTKKPICAGCYFQLRENDELVDEIFERSENDVWGIEEGDEDKET